MSSAPVEPDRPKPSAASNALSLVWFVAVAALTVRLTKKDVLAKVHLADAPAWWFIGALVAVTAAWAAVEWKTLGPWLSRTVATAKEVGFASVLGVLASVLPLVGSVGLYAYIGTVSRWLREHPQGVWLYLVAFIVLGGVALLPTYAQSAVGGYAFGVATGVPLALGGFAGASVLGYLIALRASPERVQGVVDRDPRAGAVRRALVSGGFWGQTGVVTLLRLPPTSPFALTNLVLAAAGVRLWPFVIGTVLGMTPRTAAAVVIGAGVAELSKEMSKDALETAMPRWVWWGGIAVTVVVLAVIMLVARRALAGVLKRHA
ncbi:MAG: VTT domain-containing protein [Phycisphaerales bacterium]|nr:VTT domain-containing protein [Phycisphaerales bacterium]